MVLSYLGVMSMQIVDLYFVGKISPEAVGAVGIGGSIFAWFLVIGMGMLAGLDYWIPFYQGKGEPENSYRVWRQSHVISGAMGIVFTLGVLLVAEVLPHLSLNPAVVPQAQSYLRILGPSLIPLFFLHTARQYVSGLGHTTPAFWAMLIGNIVNFALNALWVDPYGVAGSAWGTVVARWFMFALLIAFAIRESKKLTARPQVSLWNPKVVRDLIQRGLPAGTQMGLEVGVFGLATVLAGKWTAPELAAHQIVLNMAGTAFMVPLGLGAAAAILVGQSLGRNDQAEAKRWGWLALGFTVVFMGGSSLLFALAPEKLMRFYSSDPEILSQGAKIAILVAIFQIFDGAQGMLTGALRGAGDTRFPAVANLICHWFLGLPVALYLGFYLQWHLTGLWTGLSIGLISVSIALVYRWATLLPRHSTPKLTISE